MSREVPAGLRFRPGGPADRESLIALQWRASLGNAGHRDRLLANPDAIDIPPEQLTAGQTVVATINGADVGFAVVLDRGGGVAELDGLFVEPDHQRRGIGRRLVLEAARLARGAGARRIMVIAGLEAVEFYAAVGFRPAGTARTRFGPAARLRLEL